VFTRQTLCNCSWEVTTTPFLNDFRPTDDCFTRVQQAVEKFRTEFPSIAKKKLAKIIADARFKFADSQDPQWVRIARDDFGSIMKLVDDVQIRVD
jgi:hypothetical protein